jgi:CRP-like cAMP-binding protein
MLRTAFATRGATVAMPNAMVFPSHKVNNISPRTSATSPTHDALRSLDQLGTKVRFARDVTIFNEGDNGARCYKVVSGAVRLCKYASDGKRPIADFLLPGEYFGFLQCDRDSITAETSCNTFAISYPQLQVEKLAHAMPSMGRLMMFLMSERLMSMHDHIAILARLTARERMASFLLLLAKRLGVQEGQSFHIPMSRRDMADYLGIAMETVCRELRELKRKELIASLSVREVAINNMDALRNHR